MSKDNETIDLSSDGPTISETPRFTADQMVCCEACLRVNPPTRLNCLYCEAPLPLSESSAHLRKPVLRQPEKHEPGFNCILIPGSPAEDIKNQAEEAATLLKLKREEVENILDSGMPLPLARTANHTEAELVVERLRDLNLEAMILSDEQLGLADENLVRPRAFEFDEGGLSIHLSGAKGVTEVDWGELLLVVSGRLVTTRFEVTERMSLKSENDITDTSEFFNDEAIFDLYATNHRQTWRIGANSFDFSCLQDQKALVSGENLKRLHSLVLAKANHIKLVDTYSSVKSILEPVWPREKQTQSRGWRRDGPGKYSLGAATVNSNDTQFTRYSRLCQYFTIHPLT